MNEFREPLPQHSWFTPWHWPKWILALLACVWLICFSLSLIPVKAVRVVPGATPDQDTLEFIERWPVWGFERPLPWPVHVTQPRDIE